MGHKHAGNVFQWRKGPFVKAFRRFVRRFRSRIRLIEACGSLLRRAKQHSLQHAAAQKDDEPMSTCAKRDSGFIQPCFDYWHDQRVNRYFLNVRYRVIYHIISGKRAVIFSDYFGSDMTVPALLGGQSPVVSKGD